MARRRSQPNSTASKLNRRAILQMGAGLAIYAAWPNKARAARKITPNEVCTDRPITRRGMTNEQIRNLSHAAAASHGLVPKPPAGSQAQRAPSAPGATPTIPSQAAFLNKWPKHNLQVHFIDGNQTMAETVLTQLKKWTAVCNLKFEQSELTGSDVRVTFRNQGHFSQVGTDARGLPGEQTMNLAMNQSTMTEPYNMSVILHEFGHAMGMVHEHSSAASNLRFKSAREIATIFAGRFGEGADFEETVRLVEFNILKKYKDKELIKFSKFDADSIMIYALPGSCFTDGNAIDANLDLSDIDKEYARQLYGAPDGSVSPDDHTDGNTSTEVKSKYDSGKNPTQFTAGSEAVECYLDAGGTVEIKMVVPSDLGDKKLTIYTSGSTRVMLKLMNSSGSEIELADKSEQGSYDFMNEVIMKRLAAGTYKLSIKHPAARGGGHFKIQASDKSLDKYLFSRNKAQ